MGLMANFFRAYPWQTTLMLIALILSGMAEGIGLSALLPLLNVALGEEAVQMIPGGSVDQSQFEATVLATLERLSIAPTLGNMLLIVLGGIFFKCVFLLLAQRQVGYTAARVTQDLRLQMLRAILRSKWEYFLHQPVGRLTNSLATEAQRSSDAFINGSQAITYLITALVYGGVAFALSWKASLVAIGAGVIVIGLSHFLVKMTRKAGRRQTRLMTSLMSNLTDTLQSVKPVKAMAREELADQVLAHDTRLLNKAQRKMVLSGALLDSAQELMFTAFICLGVYVAMEIYDMGLPVVGVLVVGLGQAFSYFGKVQKQYQKMAQGESAYWALLAAIEQAESKEEDFDGGSAPTFDQGLSFCDVHFNYDDRHPVFSGLNLEIEAGALTTLVGPSGSGKTTIIDLAIGLLQPQQGSVALDGVSLTDIDIKAWRRMIGYVPQDTTLLHDSILHNVTLGDPDISASQAQEALQAAGAWEFVAKLDEGMATIVGERGGKLSGGQRQRIVIARALVNQPRLLILDEATSALDRDSEEAVRQTMERLKGQLTILSISHNRAMVKAADRVYELSAAGAELLDAQARSDFSK
ncbi:MAG: ABC transporter ATP-binding protein/permease [Gammaproteobacteria bacterium]|nr:ABC transporter ATP-binding protein/permease [Gammaproteobacteria bacterium]